MLKPEKPWVVDFIKGSVTKELNQWLVIVDHQEVVAALSEVLGLFEGPGDGQSFPFDWGVASFCRAEEARSC